MFYVVERYLPGLTRSDLLPGLCRLELAIEELAKEGTVMRYLGSTVVLADEACFCQLEGPSEKSVAEANRRAGLPFDRIVPALLVHPTHRSHEMSISTSVPQTARLGRSRIVIAAVLAAVLAVTAWAVATYAVGSGSRPGNHAVPTQASVLSTLTPQQQQYVLGIAAMTPTQIAAAFGTGRPSGDSAVLASLTPQQRRYVQAIASMSYAELAAAFGTGK